MRQVSYKDLFSFSIPCYSFWHSTPNYLWGTSGTQWVLRNMSLPLWASTLILCISSLSSSKSSARNKNKPKHPKPQGLHCWDSYGEHLVDFGVLNECAFSYCSFFLMSLSLCVCTSEMHNDAEFSTHKVSENSLPPLSSMPVTPPN